MGNLLGGQNLRVEYPDKLLLDDVTVGVSAGDRIGIVGRNGDGKSTLMRVLFGTQQPHSGFVTRRNGLRVALLGQEDALSGSDTVETVLLAGSEHHEVLSDPRIREVLDGLLPTIEWESPVEALSGGQKRRLQILLLLLEEPNVMILDEPTNDIDTDTLTALEDVLDAWPGTLLVVSHDRYLIERITDNQYAVIDHGLRHLPGGVDEYLELAEQARPTSRPKSDEPSTSQKPLVNGKTGSKADYETQKRLQSLERKIAKAAAQVAQIESQLADTDPADYEQLADLAKELQTARRQVEQLEEQWLDAAEEL